MIETLKELVFGEKSYEKVKIEERFETILQILNKISIHSIEEFEILESCIFKIKDQLRIKSSNLNTIIKKNNSLNKKKVEEIISKLEHIKYDLIELAFKHKPKSIESNIDNLNIENSVNEKIQEFKEVKKSIEEEKKEEDKLTKVQENPIQIVENNKVHIKLNNNSIPKIFEYAKNLSSLIFETQMYYATIIVINSENSQVIGIKPDQEKLSPLISNSKDPSTIDTAYDLIMNHSSKEYIDVENKEIEKSNNNIQTHKFEEDSLEELLSKPEKDNEIFDKNEFIKENENNEEKSNENNIDNTIIIEKKDPTEQIERVETYIDKNNSDLKPKDNENNKGNKTIESKQDIIKVIPKNENTIYSDENLSLEVTKNSLAICQVDLILNQKNSLKEADQKELLFSSLFSKEILNAIFNTIKCDATMLISNLNSKTTHLLSRNNEDSIFNFKHEAEREEVLDQVYNKILDTMKESIENNNNSNNNEVNIESQKKPETISQNISQEVKTEKEEEKAKYLLSSLRRLA